MTASKELVKSGSNDLENYFGMNADMLKAVITDAIKMNDNQKLLGIQKYENGGEKRTYYLVKRPSKKLGYIYQVKYIDPDTNEILPTKYSTGTNDLDTAIRWAESNRKNLLAGYEGKAELTLLETYYSDTSTYFQYEKYDGRKLSPIVMNQRQAFMNNHIIPFLQLHKVRFLSQITPIHIRQLKNYLTSEKKLTPQTCNYNLHSFKLCLGVFRDMGKITTDFSGCSFNIKGAREAERHRDIYEIDDLKGVFSKRWKSEKSKLLSMAIYFTGMRNSEILRIQLNDIEKVEGVYLLNVRGTKSKTAVRVVPLHPMLYTALKKYAKENGIGEEVPIFQGVYNNVFRRTNFDMGAVMGCTKKELLARNICYYSGRHSFFSCMATANAQHIADIPLEAQQLFGGHTINKEELAKRGIKQYNYIHLKSNAFVLNTAREILKMIDHYYL